MKTMNTVLKSILAGALLGAALFIMPFFLIRFVLFLLLIGAVFRLFGGRRFRRGWGRGYAGPPYAFADRIRQMSDEEYNQFKTRFRGHRHCGRNWSEQTPSNNDNPQTTNA